jgi:hypothetical protein
MSHDEPMVVESLGVAADGDLQWHDELLSPLAQRGNRGLDNIIGATERDAVVIGCTEAGHERIEVRDLIVVVPAPRSRHISSEARNRSNVERSGLRQRGENQWLWEAGKFCTRFGKGPKCEVRE